MVLNHDHVAMFIRWAVPRTELVIGEAGPHPVWRVNISRIGKARLVGEGYVPWRYRKMSENPENQISGGG